MMSRTIIGILILTCFMSCLKREYYFNEHLTEEYKPDQSLESSWREIIPLGDTAVLYFLAMRRVMLFEDGELSFKIEASYDPDQASNQLSCFLFDNEDRVFYFTNFRRDLMDDIKDPDLSDGILPLPDTIKVDTHKNAMQGRYEIHDGRIVMILEKFREDHPVTLFGNVDDSSFTLDIMHFARETFPVIHSVDLDGKESTDENKDKMRYYDLNDLFTIDTMMFARYKKPAELPIISYSGIELKRSRDFWDTEKVAKYLGKPKEIPKRTLNMMRQSR